MPPWIHWFEIPVEDLPRAQAFYEGLFGVALQALEPAPGLKMALFPGEHGGLRGGALVQHPAFYKPGAQGPLLYLGADPDLAPVLARVEGLGGKVLIPKRLISPERGFMAVFQDSEGNRVALHSAR